MCSQLVLILISPSKSADWGYNMSSHERFKVLWKKKVPSTVWVLSQIMKHKNIKGYMLKCAVYLYSLYVCIKPFVKKKKCKIHLPGQRKLSVMLANFNEVGFLQMKLFRVMFFPLNLVQCLVKFNIWLCRTELN